MKRYIGALTVALVSAGLAQAAFAANTAEKKLDAPVAKVAASKVEHAGNQAAHQAAKNTNQVADKTQAKAVGDIVEVAVANNFKTLAKLLGDAGLVTTLKGEGPFTVFAPTDEAFAKLPAATLEDLQKPENKQKLTNILTYHVVSGKILSADLKGKKLTPESVAGEKLTVDATGADVKVDNAKVTKADVAASNGVIHVVDTVLLPAEKSDK